MRVLTVSQALTYLRELIETDVVLADIWVAGEVSGPRQHASGHTYFTLKDDSAQLRGVLFRSALLRQRRLADHLEQGAQVIVHGRLTVYEARGELQVVVDFVQPQGVGLRHAQLERLRLQLEEEGLFDPARKRPLPAFPRRIGVVTSPVGAVFHDICNVLRRRWPLAEVVLAPTPVQGPEAAPGVVAAIDQLNREGDIDVIIVARGGGSVEELWAFNEESVARAVFASAAPVVSAVGHETDVTICDQVADLRAPTPSAAAELVAPDRRQLLDQIAGRVRQGAAALAQAAGRGLAATVSLLARAQRAAAEPQRLRAHLAELERRAFVAATTAHAQHAAGLRRCQAQLAALSPQATLGRGYAVVHKAGRVVQSVRDVATGDDLVVRVVDGGFPARVQAGPRRRAARAAAKSRDGRQGEQALQPVLFP